MHESGGQGGIDFQELAIVYFEESFEGDVVLVEVEGLLETQLLLEIHRAWEIRSVDGDVRDAGDAWRLRGNESG